MGRVPCEAGRPPAKHGKCCAAPTNVPLETRGVCTQDERDATYEQDPGHDSRQTAGDWTHAAKWTQQKWAASKSAFPEFPKGPATNNTEYQWNRLFFHQLITKFVTDV